MEATESSSLNPTTGSREISRVGKSRATAPNRAFNPKSLLLSGLFLIIGLALGLVYARNRYRGGQAEAAVNGVVITDQQLYHRLENVAGEKEIREMAGDELRFQFAKKENMAPSEQAVDAEYNKMIGMPIVKKALQYGKFSAEDLRDGVRNRLVQQAVLTQNTTASDEDVKKFYVRNTDKSNPKALFYTPESVRLQVIVTKDKQKIDQAMKALNDNIPFDNVVGRFSDDQTKLSNGMLGPILRGRTSGKAPELENAIFGMKIGDIVGPKQFSGVWWIIRCIDRNAEVTQPFDKVRDQCILNVKIAKMPDAQKKKIDEDFKAFQNKSVVQAFNPRYKSALDFH